MALILQIETATDVCSVCLSKGPDIIAIQELTNFSDHAAQITLMIEACFREASMSLSQIDAVAISQGPGSYTALRIGISTAKGICYALSKPLIAVDTLLSLALAAYALEQKNALYCPMIDARRMDVYAALFDVKGNQVQAPAALTVGADTFGDWFEKGHELVFCGNGASKCQAVLSSPLAHFSSVICSSKHLIPLALRAFDQKHFADLAYFEPFYLKPPNITTPRKNLL